MQTADRRRTQRNQSSGDRGCVYARSLRKRPGTRRTGATTARGPGFTAGTIRPVRRAIAGIGRTLVTLGLLILLFVVYQLWGTGIFTARAQDNLEHDVRAHIQQLQDENDTVAPVPTTAKPGTSVPT